MSRFQLYAEMIDDAYIDLAPSYRYKVKEVRSDDYVILEGSPRRYKTSSFQIYKNDKKITFEEAYRSYKLGILMDRYGV